MAAKRVVSVSLNQVTALATTDNNMVIHRQKVGQICVVGNVLNVNEQTTKITYLLTDYTGPSLEVVLWKNAGDQDNRVVNFPVIMEQTYAKIYGQARKDSNGNVFIVAFNVQPLANLNDLTMHLLEVVHHSRCLKKSKLEHLCNSQTGTTNGQMSNGQNASGFNEIQNLVMNLIKADTSDIGISLSAIRDSLRSVKQDLIKSATEFLLDEGFIYETIENEENPHYKSSD